MDGYPSSQDFHSREEYYKLVRVTKVRRYTAGLLHGQLMAIQRGKMPDQGLLEKIVQHMSGATSNGQGAPPSDDDMERLLELAMAEPDETVN